MKPSSPAAALSRITACLAVLLILHLSPSPSSAGGTPAAPGGLTANKLLTPGGGSAAPSVGDYITSSQADGLNEPYILYIEVPPGQTELQVDLFDADIFAGGMADRTGERDQDRNAFRTRARYRLFDPAGNRVGTRFSYGDNNDPAGADSAWSLFFDDDTSGITGGTTFTDDFSSGDYAGGTGFSTNWIESNDLGGGGSAGGDVRVVSQALRLSNASDTSPFLNKPSVQREVDLSGFVAAELRFDWTTGSGVDRLDSTTANIGDTFVVEMSANGGTTWEEIDTIADVNGTASGTEVYDITEFISSTTRVRLRIGNRYAAANEFIDIDNVQIRATTTANGPDPANGHWRLEIDTSGNVNGIEAGNGRGGDDVNAIGVRAHDGTSGAGGQEYNIYADSFLIAGINNNDRARSYNWYPWVTSGCEMTTHDFDWDANQPNPPAPNTNTQPYGSIVLTSRSGGYMHTNSTMSDNNDWRDETNSGYTSADTATDYGIWQMAVRIADWDQNNYGPVYITEFDGAASPPTAQPEPNTFRLYLPADGGTAPIKPYVGQFATYLTNSSGSNPPTVGQTSRYAITVRVTNPAGSIGDITFSASDTVTSTVPGGQVTYGGLAFTTSGSVVSQPSIGGSGDVVWNPGTLAPGDFENITYFVDVTPTAAYTTIDLTGAPGSGDGTIATYLDETEGSSSRATFTFGELCELRISSTNATQALVASLRAVAEDDGALWVEWQTAAEAETLRFDLLRFDETAGDGDSLGDVVRGVPAQIDAPQGGVYRVLDAGLRAEVGDELAYALIETEPDGRERLHGPFPVVVEAADPRDGALGAVNAPRAMPEHQLERRAVADRVSDRESAAVGSARPGERKSRLAPTATVRAAGTGLLRVPLDQLATALGLDLATVTKHAENGTLRVTTRVTTGGLAGDVPQSGPQEVAWRFTSRAAPATRNALSSRSTRVGDPAIELWLTPPDASSAVFDLERVFKITLGQGLTMATRDDGAPPTSWSSESFRTSIDLERDLRPVVQLPLDPFGDVWFWGFVNGTDVRLDVEGPPAPVLDAAEPARLTARLQGGAVGDHEIELLWDGTFLGTAELSDFEAAEATFTLDQVLLDGSLHEVEMAVRGIGDFVLLDGFAIEYERHDAPTDGQILVAADGLISTAGPFSTPSIDVFDLSDPLRPVELADRGVVAVDGGWRAVWRTDDRPGPFAAVARGTVVAPVSVETDTPSDLLSARFQVDYLVVAAPGLVAAAEELAALRAERGLDTLVVDVEDVYDEFSGGVRDPRALRDFFEHALAIWTKAPRWIVLAGAGSFDYRDLLGFGGGLVPPLLANDGSSLVASDQSYVDLDGDGVPAAAIGRIPALSDAELRAYVDKLRAYETETAEAETATDGWRSRVLFGVDAPDGEADFAADAAALAALLPAGFDVETVTLGTTPNASSAFADALRAGVGWVGWVGHGGVGQLGRTQTQTLLTSAEVTALGNGIAPVLAAVSCHIGYHALPHFDSLGEELVIAPDGGATAVIAPVWLSDHPEAGPFADRLTRAIFQSAVVQDGSGESADARTVGEALRSALAAAAGAGVDPELLRVYQILGDPATLLRSMPAPLEQDCDNDCGGPG